MSTIVRTRENWYRDVWLFLLSILVFVVLIVSVNGIKQTRRESVVRACVEQNAHHTAVIRTFDNLIRELPPGAERTKAEAGRTSTVLLLEAIAPYENCKDRANRLIR